MESFGLIDALEQATGQFSGSAVGVALAMGAHVVALGRNRDILQRLTDTFGATDRLTTVPISPNLEDNISNIRSAAPAGFSAILDLTPPAAAGNTYLPAAVSLLKQGGRVALMGGMGGELRVPFEAIVHKDLKFFGKWMYSREQVVRGVQLAEMGLLGLGKKAGVETKGGFGLGEIDTAVEQAAREVGWGVQVVVEP